jgi:ADP-ribosylglycohydrolase
MSAIKRNDTTYYGSADKFIGCIFGHALGDALGSPHERDKKEKYPYTGKLQYQIESNRMFSTPIFSCVGQVSDDTEMAFVVLRQIYDSYKKGTTIETKIGLTSTQDEDFNNKIILRYMEWANSGIPFLGRNTRRLFKGITTIRGYNSRKIKHFNSDEDKYNAQANGALMRAYPFAFLTNKNKALKMAKDDCYRTNPNEISACAVVTYVGLLHDILHNDLPLEQNIEKAFQYACSNSTIKNVLEQKNHDIVKGGGWIVTALWVMFRELKIFVEYAETINNIINEKGDCDTNAAITGAVIGAVSGIRKMIHNPITKANINIMVSANTQTCGIPRPVDLYPNFDLGYLCNIISNIP